MSALKNLATAIVVLYTQLSLAQDHPVIWANKFNDDYAKVQQVGFSSDSRQLAVGYNKGTVVIFNTDSGFVTNQYIAHEYHVFCTKFRPGTTAVASGDRKGNVLLHDYVTGKDLYRLQAHKKAVTCIYFTSDGKLMLTGSKDKTIKVWDAATGNLLHNLPCRRAGKVQSLYVTPDGNTVIAGITELSRGLRFYDMNAGVETENYEIGNMEHFDVAPDGVSFAIGSLNRKMYLFNLKKRAITAELKGHKRWVTDVCYNNTGRVLFSGSNDNKVFAWLADGSKHMPIFHTRRDIDVVRCSPDGKYLVIMAQNEQLTMMNVEHIEDEIRAYKPPVK